LWPLKASLTSVEGHVGPGHSGHAIAGQINEWTHVCGPRRKEIEPTVVGEAQWDKKDNLLYNCEKGLLK